MSTPEQPVRAPVPGASAPRSAEEEREAIKAANRFDIRRLIGGLFTLYGVILTVLGIAGSPHVKHQAAGINVDLWTGIGMLIFGVLMIVWALSRPVAAEPPAQGQAVQAMIVPDAPTAQPWVASRNTIWLTLAAETVDGPGRLPQLTPPLSVYQSSA